MHLRPHPGPAGSPEDPESVAPSSLRSSSSYPSLPIHPHLPFRMERENLPSPPLLRQIISPPDRTSIPLHTTSSVHHHYQYEQHIPSPPPQQHVPDQTQSYWHYQTSHSASSSPFQRDRQHEISSSFNHPHLYRTRTIHSMQQHQGQQQQQQEQQRFMPSPSSSYYNEQDQDQGDQIFIQHQNQSQHSLQDRLPSQSADKQSIQQQHQHQHQYYHHHQHHNTPPRVQHDDNSSRPHTHLTPAYSPYPSEHNQYHSSQRRTLQTHQHEMHLHQQQQWHAGVSPSHDQTQRPYRNQHEQQPHQRTNSLQVQESNDPGADLHNTSNQQQQQQKQQPSHGSTARGQDFGSTMIPQHHSYQSFQYQHQPSQPDESHCHASLPSLSHPHSTNYPYSSSSSSSSSSPSAYQYSSHISPTFASVSTPSLSPGSSFQRHRAKTLSSVSPYFSSLKPSLSYPSEATVAAIDNDVYISSASQQLAPEWSSRRKRGRASQFSRFEEGSGSNHRGGKGSVSGGDLTAQAQTALHQRRLSQDSPMTMESTFSLSSVSNQAKTIFPANTGISYSSSLPSDLWMRDSPVAQFPRPSQTVDSSRRLWPLEDHRQQTQREHTESTTEANFIGSKVGPESGPSMDFSDNSNSGLTTMTMRQDRISAMGAPKSYGQNKRPLILSPPIESDSLASFDRSPPLISAGPSSLQQQQLQQQNHNYRYYQYQQEHQIPQQQQYRPSTQTQGRSLEAGMAISRENEVQEQGAQQHNQNNISSSTTTTLREKLPESMPRANPLSLNSRRTIQTLPMPHFRGQLVQSQPDDSSYQRRFYPSSSSVKSFNQDTAVAHTTASAGMMSSTTSTSTPSAMTTTGATLSTLAGHPTSKSVSPSPGINMRKSTSVKRLQQLADNMSSGNNPSSGNASQDTSGVIGIQLGRLLISTRQHVKGLLDSFIRVKGDVNFKNDINAVHPNLEHVLLYLLNGMLQSHNAFATRDSISSQEQPITFRPTLVRSLAHLHELLYPTYTYTGNHIHITPTHALSSSAPSSIISSPSHSLSSSPSSSSSHLTNRNYEYPIINDSSKRHKSLSRHPPSRLSTTTSYNSEVMDIKADMESDTALFLESDISEARTTAMNPDIHLHSMSSIPIVTGATTPSAPTAATPISVSGTADASNQSHLPHEDWERLTTDADLYKSTIEFLALMTAFVSVVCWLMQTRLLDDRLSTLGHNANNFSTTMEDIQTEREKTNMINRESFNLLKEFLSQFDDLDNVLNPIKEALSRNNEFQQKRQFNDEQEGDTEIDPMDSVGLFAWHYYLFASDQDSPFELEASAIDVSGLHSVHFDVIINELYTTHILSMTAKEHQKDHGQFYTPPGVVDFMWKRTIIERGRLLDQFVELMPKALSTFGFYDHVQSDTQKPLIPTALDPCLGVSTFLSCYIRLLIQEAERDHTESIWKSEAACRLLLTQICEHVWGIELDGFAFWMARCGILVALMPLVQHIKSFTRRPFYYHNYIHNQIPLTQEQKQQQQQQQGNLPRLHLFRSDTLQLTVPDGTSAKTVWDRHCLLQLRNPSRLQFDYIVTNPPYMIRKTGTFSAPDPEVYDWSILGATVATASSSSTASHNIPLNGSNLGSKSKFGPSTMVSKMTLHEDERRSLTPATMDTGDDDSGSEATPTAGNGSGNRVNNKSALESALQSPRSKKFMTQVRPTGSKGMMQAYGYFVWFAAQRIKPGKGVVCMITASQWLTLEFAVKLRAWLFENCLMDEFFQFEPYKVFSKVQTDSLIFKIRAIPPTLMPSTSSPPLSSSSPQPLSSLSSPLPLGDHHTVFLRHTDHRKSLAGILEDYMAIMLTPESINAANNDLNIMMSSKTREELAAVIMAPSSAVPSMSSGVPTGKSEDSTTAPTATYMYSFAPMMPTSVLTTYMLALTQDLGAICSAGTKKMNRLRAVEPLLWHRGPNTNPVYGLVVRMEYARTMFGEEMTSRWFRPALYWNGKNSPDGPATLSTGTGGSSTSGIVSVTASSMSVASSSKALHREGQFWQGRDRQRLSKKEGSPAESYCVPSSDPQRLYALCMVDKESVKILRQQMEQGVEGAQALWKYLTDVRSHFQPGLVSKRKAASSGKTQSADDEGVAYCSTNQCGSDVPEKIVHPINYGYFSKTQPRQRFFLDTDSLAVTNQCIYLTLNKLSSHYDADQCPSLTYFLTLLNSTTLQFFVLHHCQYDQQGRMRLFRESMAKIPFQDRDVKNHPERIQYVAQLGTCMIELKQILYSVVMGWKMTGSHHSIGVFQNSALGNSGRRGSTGSLASAGGTPNTIPASTTTGGGNNQGLLDWVRKGGNPPPGLLVRVREQVRRMLIAQAAREHHNHHHSFQTSDPRATSIALDPSSAMGTKGRFPDTATIITDPPTPLSSSSRSTLQLNMACSFKATDGPVFTDTDTDTNTCTDTDTDTDDTIDPWISSKIDSRAAIGISRGMGGPQSDTPMVFSDYHQHQNQDNGHSRGQGRHSLARILNMPNDDETFMDDERLITNSPQSIPVSMSVSEEFSRDQKSSRMNVDDYRIDGKLECKVKEGVESGNKGPRSTRGSIAKGTSSTSMAMETDLEGYQYHYPSVASDPIHTFDQQKIPISFDEQVALDCDRILQALERAVTMVEMLQWAVDQYGYMLYGIRPKFQKLLEVELKIVYGSRLESLILPTTPTSATATGFKEEYETQQCMNGRKKERGAGENLVTDLGITVWDLYRWEGDSEPMPSLFVTPGSGSGPSPTNAATNLSSGHPGPLSGSGNNSNINVNTKLLPSYAYQILENAQTATQLLREIFAQFPPLSSPPLAI